MEVGHVAYSQVSAHEGTLHHRVRRETEPMKKSATGAAAFDRSACVAAIHADKTWGCLPSRERASLRRVSSCVRMAFTGWCLRVMLHRAALQSSYEWLVAEACGLRGHDRHAGAQEGGTGLTGSAVVGIVGMW